MSTLVVGDDHEIFLDALAAVLTRDGFTVTVAQTVAGTLAAVARIQPDLCLIDRHFAEEDSVRAIGPLLEASPRTRVLMLSADVSSESVLAALQAGASGYLPKTCGISTLTAAISRVLHGEVAVEMMGSVSAQSRPGRDDERRLAEHLTPRERQCLALLVDGLNTATMARTLSVSGATVRAHVQSLMNKLGVHSRLEAASVAVRHRLLDGPPWQAQAPHHGLVADQRLLRPAMGRGRRAGSALSEEPVARPGP